MIQFELILRGTCQSLWLPEKQQKQVVCCMMALLPAVWGQPTLGRRTARMRRILQLVFRARKPLKPDYTAILEQPVHFRTVLAHEPPSIKGQSQEVGPGRDIMDGGPSGELLFSFFFFNLYLA